MKIVRIFVCLLLIFTVISASGNVLVRKTSTPMSNGDIFYVGGTGPGNYTKIQDAIDDASDGDTVFVFDDSSPYYESIQVNTSINLVGEDRNTTIIDANGSSHNILIASDGVSIHEFTIQNSKYGIDDIGFGFCTFSDNIIINTFGCILIWRGCNNTIEGNTFFNYETFGLTLFSSDNNTISSNSFSNFPGSNYNWGITISGSKWNNISYNTFIENMIGIGLGSSSDNNLILNNIISFNDEIGIGIGASSNNAVIGNVISSCADYGLSLTVYSKNNIIFHNNFEFNGVNAKDLGYNNTWDDDYPSGGNYWDDYTGEDNDGDGIGDTPYPIPGVDNEDRYPLMFPWGEPGAPIIDGPSSGKPDVEICFTFHSTDPDDDEVKYIIYWGDGPIVETGYNPSCEPVEVCHTWNEKDTYTIAAKVVDIWGYESDWSLFEVNIPRTRTSSYLWYHWFLERFPLLEKLLNLIKVY